MSSPNSALRETSRAADQLVNFIYPTISEVHNLSLEVNRLVESLYLYLYRNGPLPQIPSEDLYNVIYGLWFAIDYTLNMSPRRELPLELYRPFYEEGDTMFHPAVELALAVCSPIYAFRLKSKMIHRRGNSSGLSDPWEEIKTMVPAHLKYLTDDRSVDSYPNHALYARLSTPTFPLVLGSEKNRDTIFRVDRYTLLKRLEPYSLPVFSIEGGGCALAGGFLFALSNDKLYKNPERFRSSDIDLFVYGKEDVREEALQRVLDFYEGYPKSYTRTTVEIDYPERDSEGVFTRKIQVVLSPALSVEDILISFDLSHIQLAYDGVDIYSTTESNFFASYGETILVAPNLRGSRIRKAILDGVDVRRHGWKVHLVDGFRIREPYVLAGAGEVIHNGRLMTRVSRPVPHYISEEEFRERHYFIPFLLSMPYAGLEVEDLPPEGTPLTTDTIYVYTTSTHHRMDFMEVDIRGIPYRVSGPLFIYDDVDPMTFSLVTTVKPDSIVWGTFYLLYKGGSGDKVLAIVRYPDSF
jgi:hypothetical protein